MGNSAFVRVMSVRYVKIILWSRVLKTFWMWCVKQFPESHIRYRVFHQLSPVAFFSHGAGFIWLGSGRLEQTTFQHPIQIYCEEKVDTLPSIVSVLALGLMPVLYSPNWMIGEGQVFTDMPSRVRKCYLTGRGRKIHLFTEKMLMFCF